MSWTEYRNGLERERSQWRVTAINTLQNQSVTPSEVKAVMIGIGNDPKAKDLMDQLRVHYEHAKKLEQSRKSKLKH